MIVYCFDAILRQPRTQHTLPIFGHRVQLPRPMPLIAIGYAAGIFLVVTALNKVFHFVDAIGFVLSHLAGGRADLTAGVLFYVVLPFVVAYAAINAQIDGRAPYRWIYSVARYPLRPKTTWCDEPVRAPGDQVRYRARVRVMWDVNAPRLQHGWIRGGRVTTTVPARFALSLRHRHRVLAPDDGFAPIVDYEVEGSLQVRP